ncbi:MAG: hypothetical protein DCF25_06495 [Leptolyngbya foveolarum]|uniref:Uncharacterized protein n=1 Tax=Leptolyngbya foveolarum TaxID=47253 RepID=A0A2W4WDN4_9CYAN|nr:MAG: hypothetical protein DCF25_06495 [Leptolyngbya foveolarum]
MEKYAVVKEKLKKLSAEQTRGDRYDPFLPAQKEAKNACSKQPHNRSAQESTVHNKGAQDRALQTNEPLAFKVEPAHHYSSQAATFSVARAIGTLQHRSYQAGEISEGFDEVLHDRPFVTELAAYEDDLVTQEIHRLEMRAVDINHRSQQQAEDILGLKKAAQRAAIALTRQGIHDHPQLDIINRFFDRYAVSHVPMIKRDDCGYFTLGDYSINLRRAEEEAIENAAVLRGDRYQEALPAVIPFSQPIDGKTTLKQHTQPTGGGPRTRRRKESDRLTRLQDQMNHAISGLSTLWKASLRSMPANASRKPISEGVTAEQYIEKSREFSLADGAIWFSAAAIVARLVLNTLVSVLPIFQPILWLAPLGLFCYAIYLLFVVKSSNSTLMYRLVLVALGLFLSGSLS